MRKNVEHILKNRFNIPDEIFVNCTILIQLNQIYSKFVLFILFFTFAIFFGHESVLLLATLTIFGYTM
jgi:hypothetical protein